PWEHKAFQASTIPQNVKDALSAIEKSIPNARIELIKQDKPQRSDEVTFFVARSSGDDPALYRYDLNGYEDLFWVDIPAIAEGRHGPHDASRVDEPIAIVCTNGRRDACCARNGLPVYQAMALTAPRQVWECTHLGGHRLSPNVA